MKKFFIAFCFLMMSLTHSYPAYAGDGPFLSWDPVADAKGYHVCIVDLTLNKSYMYNVGDVLQHPISDLSLGPGKYECTIRAYNDFGKSAHSNMVEFEQPAYNPDDDVKLPDYSADTPTPPENLLLNNSEKEPEI